MLILTSFWETLSTSLHNYSYYAPVSLLFFLSKLAHFSVQKQKVSTAPPNNNRGLIYLVDIWIRVGHKSASVRSSSQWMFTWNASMRQQFWQLFHLHMLVAEIINHFKEQDLPHQKHGKHWSLYGGILELEEQFVIRPRPYIRFCYFPLFNEVPSLLFQ